MTAVRGLRGATTVLENSQDEIMDATEELLNEMIAENDIESQDIAAVFFTLTKDLDAEFPAVAARERLGWNLVPLINAIEVARPGSMPRCIRIMLLLNTDKSQEDIRHIYLREAVVLRADITDAQ